MSQSQQDELSQLFARSMNVSQSYPQHPATPDKQFIMQQSVQPQIIYSSQHYTGAYHICPTEKVVEQRADSPLSMPTDDLEQTLRQSSINPTSLSPAQKELFANADYEQRLRLVELWRISPPVYSEHRSQPWYLSTVAQEEEMARLRYERRRSEEEASKALESHDAEPYVLSGYANAQRIDPVYAAAAAGRWQANSYAQAVEQMQYQYGGYPHAEQMAHMQAQQGRDDEMVM